MSDDSVTYHKSHGHHYGRHNYASIVGETCRIQGPRIEYHAVIQGDGICFCHAVLDQVYA